MDPRPLTAPAVVVAVAAAHTAWVLGPWGRAELSGAWAAGATVVAAGLLAVALARRALAPLLVLPVLWGLSAPGLTGPPAWIALATLGCHLGVALAWRAAAPAGLDEALSWADRSAEPPRSLSPAGAGPWAAAPLAAIAAAVCSPQAVSAAGLAWRADPGRALAGLGAAGVAGALLFAASASRPRLALRGSAGRAAWLGVHACAMLGLWWWLA